MFHVIKETAICPVCRAVLGAYNPETVYRAHCVECLATFWWKPGHSTPSVTMDKDSKTFRGYCGPQGCVCKSQH